MRVTSVTPCNECYTHACNPNGVPIMRITKRDALPCRLQANLQPELRSYHASYKSVMLYNIGYKRACNPNELQ
eukprot:6174013-Pleurochrysis_carterae.AAC.1